MQVGDTVKDKQTQRAGIIERITEDDDGCILWVRWDNQSVVFPCFMASLELVA